MKKVICESVNKSNKIWDIIKNDQASWKGDTTLSLQTTMESYYVNQPM